MAKKTSLPEGKRRFSLYITEKLFSDLEEIGQYNGLDNSALINLAISKYIREEQAMRSISTNPLSFELIEKTLKQMGVISPDAENDELPGVIKNLDTE